MQSLVDKAVVDVRWPGVAVTTAIEAGWGGEAGRGMIFSPRIRFDRGSLMSPYRPGYTIVPPNLCGPRLLRPLLRGATRPAWGLLAPGPPRCRRFCRSALAGARGGHRG